MADKGYQCALSGVLVEDRRCLEPRPQCVVCGWNPKVHRQRVKELRLLAELGRLREWGK